MGYHVSGKLSRFLGRTESISQASPRWLPWGKASAPCRSCRQIACLALYCALGQPLLRKHGRGTGHTARALKNTRFPLPILKSSDFPEPSCVALLLSLPRAGGAIEMEGSLCSSRWQPHRRGEAEGGSASTETSKPARLTSSSEGRHQPRGCAYNVASGTCS